MARKLLNANKAAVFRRYPFTIILKKAVDATPEPLVLKLDPGSKTTGIAILKNDELIFVADLIHRGYAIKSSIESRSSHRRGRRQRKTRYRQPRFLNRKRPKGWLAPSLKHRVLTTKTWIEKFRRSAPIGSISLELVRFDLQKLETPEISGIEYQQGTLLGYEVREYLLFKWNRKCAYCGAENIPLQIEHIQARANGGTDRISNLALACDKCNKKKGIKDIKQFLAKKPEVLKRVLSQAKASLLDAAAVNSTRWDLFRCLKETGLSVTTGSGGLTKFNRTRLSLPKTHHFDAACVGATPDLRVLSNQPLTIKSVGLGTRQMCGTNKYGFPLRHRSNTKIHKGFQTGDMVKAVVPSGKKTGVHVGRVLCRALGTFDISTKHGRVAGISYKFCTHIHQKDGYSYTF